MLNLVNKFINTSELASQREKEAKNKEIDELKEKIKKLEEENEILKKNQKSPGDSNVSTGAGSVQDKSGEGQK